MKAAVVVPTHTFDLNAYEAASFLNNTSVLSCHDIYVICPKSIQLGAHERIINERHLSLSKFDDRWFTSRAAYNALCLQSFFYETFSQYDYMLICQNDAWIFNDQLLSWCIRGYDYVGAPWCHYCKNNSRCSYDGHPVDGKMNVIGNGGLSLRKVSKFIAASKTINSQINGIPHDKLPNEDDLFMNNHELSWNLPSCREAICFSLESMSQFHIENGICPMGYHNLLNINAKAAFQLHFTMNMKNAIQKGCAYETK